MIINPTSTNPTPGIAAGYNHEAAPPPTHASGTTTRRNSDLPGKSFSNRFQSDGRTARRSSNKANRRSSRSREGSNPTPRSLNASPEPSANSWKATGSEAHCHSSNPTITPSTTHASHDGTSLKRETLASAPRTKRALPTKPRGPSAHSRPRTQPISCSPSPRGRATTGSPLNVNGTGQVKASNDNRSPRGSSPPRGCCTRKRVSVATGPSPVSNPRGVAIVQPGSPAISNRNERCPNSDKVRAAAAM